MQQTEVYHYTVRKLADGRYECLVEELEQTITADTERAALLAGEELVAKMLYKVSSSTTCLHDSHTSGVRTGMHSPG